MFFSMITVLEQSCVIYSNLWDTSAHISTAKHDLTTELCGTGDEKGNRNW
jgi:hypothetical protein